MLSVNKWAFDEKITINSYNDTYIRYNVNVDTYIYTFIKCNRVGIDNSIKAIFMMNCIFVRKDFIAQFDKYLVEWGVKINQSSSLHDGLHSIKWA